MVHRDEIIGFIHETIGSELLDRAVRADEMPNGIQILGSDHVDVVTLGVSLNEEFLIEATKRKSNLAVFHHGFDPRTWKSRVPIYSQKRLKRIFAHDMTIAGYHYALDVHPEIGNNATIARKLGAVLRDTLFEGWGYVAVLPESRSVTTLRKQCEALFAHEVFAVTGGPRDVQVLGIVSGAAKPYAEHIAEMEAKGVELFITGETSESVPHRMQESGINYFVGGHYATEVFGIRELEQKLHERFTDRLKVEFIDIKNPI